MFRSKRNPKMFKRLSLETFMSNQGISWQTLLSLKHVDSSAVLNNFDNYIQWTVRKEICTNIYW